MAKVPITETTLSNKGRAADGLVRIFVELIESGRLQEGEALPPEREIVETYGVSRTVAREAVQTLANRGLVESRPRFRPVVKRPSYETALDTVGTLIGSLMRDQTSVEKLFEARIFVEAALAREVALHAAPSDISKLAHALHANKNAIDDSVRFYDTDRAFHRVFYEVSGNPVLLAAHKAFVEWLSPHWKRMPDLRARNEDNYISHQVLFDAVQNGDAAAAEAALRKHLSDAWSQVSDTFS